MSANIMQDSDSNKIASPQHSRPYLSYMVRLWLANDGDKSVWHVSAEVPGTGERQGFARLAEFFAFLQKETAVHSHEHE